MLQTSAEVEWGQKSARVAATVPEAYAKLRGKVVPFEHFWKTHGELLDAFVSETPEFAAARKAGATHAAALAQLTADAAFMTRLRDDKTRLEASFVALDPASGEVRAWVGSRDFKLDQFDHVVQAERQPGSTFKPFVYGAALEHGINSGHTYVDEPVEFHLSDGKTWRPTDMGGASGQPMTLREGLVRSKNTITVQVMRDVGVPGVVRLAQAMGVDRSKLDPVPSLALGTSPVTLLEMVSGYSTIAGAGQYRKPITVKRIVDRHGKVLAEFGTDGRRAMSERSAVELIDMMRGVITQGTGQAIKTRFGIVADLGGKTGTTQRNSDGWFIAMHPRLVAGAWVGFNDNRVTMRSNYWGQGGHNAIFIVGDFLRATLGKGRLDANAQFPRPPKPLIVAESLVQGTEQTQAPAGSDPVFLRLVRDPVFGSSPRPARTAEEVSRLMESMGREPETGRIAGPRPSIAPAAPPVVATPPSPLVVTPPSPSVATPPSSSVVTPPSPSDATPPSWLVATPPPSLPPSPAEQSQQ
jgi:penicillin-binding protein 1A